MILPKIIRATHSICPKCLKIIEANIIERDNNVFLHKTCYEHGVFEILLSKTPQFYIPLEEYYFSVMDKKYDVPEYELWPTYRCNMDCSICSWGRQNQDMTEWDPPFVKIEKFVKETTKRFFILSGGEPTCREDLVEIIKIFKKYGKIVTINSNGKKLIDIEYLKQLKESGLDRVNLQFDGFKSEFYPNFRRQDCFNFKLKVVENLRILNIQTAFNVTVANNVNEYSLSEIIDFAAKNDFVNGINFFTICKLGEAREFPICNYIMPDEVVDLLEKQTDFKIRKKDVFIFQKLHLAIKAFLSQKWCFYNQVYLLVREKGTYQPISKFLNLEKSEYWLDRFKENHKKNKILSFLCLSLALLSLFLKLKSIFIIKEILIRGFSYFLKGKQYLKGSRFFSLSFATGCDPYKFDKDIVCHCQNEIIATENKDGELVNLGSDGHYLINLEKRHLANIN
jgi:7,8-dihydro-6-hydroxymethylpterin dimethyltransferase